MEYQTKSGDQLNEEIKFLQLKLAQLEKTQAKYKEVEEKLRESQAELEIRVKVRTAELSTANERLQSEIRERRAAEEKLKESNKELNNVNKRLQQISLKDPLTGLYNNHYLQEVVEAEFHRAKRYAHPLSVVMLDIDYFKSINDVYGLHFGDLVLKQFGRELKEVVRRYDIVSRLGGEEFVIVSPDIDREQAMSFARRLLDIFNIYNFGDKKRKVKLKLSFSCVSYPEDGGQAGVDLINLAARVLDKAKESGGNRVFSCLDLNGKKPLRLVPSSKKTQIIALKGKIDKLTRKANQSLIESILALAKTIELKDHYTGEHVENTVRYSTGIARVIGLPDEEIELIRQASMLHDLGKIGISENILLKKSKLTSKEFEEIKRHPQIGADILRPIKHLRGLIPLVFYHHERWDGKGYPSGIKGSDIPIGARIIAVADVYQALISRRPYRKAYSSKDALKIIKSSSGTQFDPMVVRAFLKVIEKE